MTKEHKSFKIGAYLGAFTCMLLLCLAFYITPNFVAKYFNPDGILAHVDTPKINLNRIGFGILGTIGLLISVLYIIKPYIFKKIFSNLNKSWILKSMIFLFPIVFVIFICLVKYFCPHCYRPLVVEDSITEWLEFICYFIAFMVSFNISITYYRSNSALFGLMYMLLAVGLFFIAMEEISWGQRIFNVHNPEFFLKYNNQKEMNLHNIKGIPIHIIYIIVGLYGAFSRFIIPKKVKIKYSSTVNLFVPDYYLFFYFFVVCSFYIYYDYISSIAVTLFGNWVGFGKNNFLHVRDQEPAELLLSCGFLLFVTINKFRQVHDKNFRPVVEKMKH